MFVLKSSAKPHVEDSMTNNLQVTKKSNLVVQAKWKLDKEKKELSISLLPRSKDMPEWTTEKGSLLIVASNKLSIGNQHTAHSLRYGGRHFIFWDNGKNNDFNWKNKQKNKVCFFFFLIFPFFIFPSKNFRKSIFDHCWCSLSIKSQW